MSDEAGRPAPPARSASAGPAASARPARPEVGKLLFGDPALAEIISRESTGASGLPRRVAADPEATERGLAGLVLAIIDLVRQLLERQAVRRMEGGSLSEDEIERLGRALMGLEEKITELRDVFGLAPEDLDLPIDLSRF